MRRAHANSVGADVDDIAGAGDGPGSYNVVRAFLLSSLFLFVVSFASLSSFVRSFVFVFWPFCIPSTGRGARFERRPTRLGVFLERLGCFACLRGWFLGAGFSPLLAAFWVSRVFCV